MSRVRTAASVVALIVLICTSAACSSGSSKPSAAVLDQRAAAQSRAAVLRARKAAVARRAAATRRRIAVARAKRLARIRTTRTSIATESATSPAGDLATIERMLSHLNTSFSASVASGITTSEVANFWVGNNVYTSDECGSFEMARGQGVVAEALIIQPDSLVPSPGWVDPVTGQVPTGRIYAMTIDEIQTLVTTGQQRTRSLTVHVTVRPDDHARLFLRCR